MPVNKSERNLKGKPAADTSSAAATELPAAKNRTLQFTLASLPPATQRGDVLVVGVFANEPLSAAAKQLDSASNGRLSALIARGDLASDPGSSVTLFDLPGTAAPRVLLVSLGSRREFREQAFLKVLRSAASVLAAGKMQDAALTLADLDVPGRSLEWRLQQAARILADGNYHFAAPITRTNGGDRAARRMTLLIADEATPQLEAAVNRGRAIAEGMALTRDLGNLPGNVCTPAYLAQTAQALGKELDFEVDVLERDDMRSLGMGSALSVGRASAHPCKFIVMRYQGGKHGAKPIVLVGKGVTFDTGGVSLKPGDDLDMMKYDMCGAASVFGAVRIAASLKMPLNLVGIVGAVENMPGGDASRPGDVVTSMSGQTIEILNTDAEGRLVLCDALTYAERFNPACVVDIATLTGACVIALGAHTSGLFANDDALAEELLECGTEADDRAWKLPMGKEYEDQLKSNFADMSNLGGRPAGAVTAACFLSRFAGAYKWAHLDIAGTASVGGDAKGSTGRPVPLLSEFLLKRSAAAAAH
jgi:leucyl aminopeptidase